MSDWFGIPDAERIGRPTVVIDERRDHMGPPRRRLKEEDRGVAELVVTACEEVRRAAQALENARAARWRAVTLAFDEGIHQLDLMRLAGIERRTVRDWHARWVAEREADEGDSPV